MIDSRRAMIVPGDEEETVRYGVTHWIERAQDAIAQKNAFYVALSGGSTPKKLFQQIASSYKDALDWSKVFLFWSDERAVPPDDPESNYHMALVEGNLNSLPIPKEQIFRLKGEGDLEANALEYEKSIQKVLGKEPFDLIMLGMGEDGHTASLFPHTKALHETKRWVVMNYINQKKVYRLSFTYPLINQAKLACFYVLGKGKATMAKRVLEGPASFEELPSQKVGTEAHPALWILDHESASLLSTTR